MYNFFKEIVGKNSIIAFQFVLMLPNHRNPIESQKIR